MVDDRSDSETGFAAPFFSCSVGFRIGIVRHVCHKLGQLPMDPQLIRCNYDKRIIRGAVTVGIE